MKAPAPRSVHAILLALLPLSAPLAGACNIFDSDDAPAWARVVMDGGAGHPVRLITTTDFDVVTSQDGQDREVFVFSADTADVAPPFDQRYPLGPRTRFFALITSDATAAENVTVSIFIDEERRYHRSTRFGDEVLEFVYAYR